MEFNQMPGFPGVQPRGDNGLMPLASRDTMDFQRQCAALAAAYLPPRDCEAERMRLKLRVNTAELRRVRDAAVMNPYVSRALCEFLTRACQSLDEACQIIERDETAWPLTAPPPASGLGVV